MGQTVEGYYEGLYANIADPQILNQGPYLRDVDYREIFGQAISAWESAAGSYNHHQQNHALPPPPNNDSLVAPPASVTAFQGTSRHSIPAILEMKSIGVTIGGTECANEK